MSALAGCIRTAVIVVHSGKRVEFCNAHALALLDCANVAQVHDVLFAPNHELDSVLERARSEPCERIIALDGRRIHLQISGSDRGWALLAHDLEWLSGVQRSMRSASLLRARERMSATSLHNVKSPMHAMTLALDVLRKTLPAEPESRSRHYVEAIVKELARLHESLQALLPKAPQNDEIEFDLNALISEVTATMRIEAALREVTFKPGGLADSAAMLGRRDEIKHALSCILLNALDASPEGGEVDIRLTREGEWARITIATIAGAMAPPESALSHSIDVEVARQIAREHGGEFYAESSRRVCFKLPLKR